VGVSAWAFTHVLYILPVAVGSLGTTPVHSFCFSLLLLSHSFVCFIPRKYILLLFFWQKTRVPLFLFYGVFLVWSCELVLI